MTRARGLAIAIAIGAAVVGVWRGTWAAGGSDSSCYALMAQALASGALQPVSVLAPRAPWPDAPTTFAPGGFIPSPVSADAASPVCAAGFAVLLAPFHLLGGRDAIFLLTPLAGACLVYLTFLFGRELSGGAVGVGSAVLTATMPVFVFQVVQPMNDVVVAALWMAILVMASRRDVNPGALGGVVGLALFVRPNLAPAGVCVAVWCAATGRRRLLAFIGAAAPFALVLLWLNDRLYGHPLRSGYGDVDDLFALSHLTANLGNYGRSLLATELGFPLLGVAALFVARPEQRRTVRMALCVAAAISVVYLLYRPLPEWWYLRFLLPVLPMMCALALAALVVATRRTTIVIPVVLIVAAYAATSPAMQEAWDLARLERRFRTAGSIARDRFAENAVFLTVWESGSVRYHAQREAVLWDSLAGDRLDAAVTWLIGQGRDPYIMIEDWEEPLFRQRFAAHSAIGQLDWPPRFDIERRVKIYRPADRASYLRGEAVPTEFVTPNRR